MPKVNRLPPSNVMTPEDFLAAYRDMRDKLRLKTEAVAAYKASRDNFFAKGGNQKSLKIVELYQGLKDGGEITLVVRETARYAAWLNLDIGTTPDLFGDDEAPPVNPVGVIQQQHSEWEAESRGYKAGIAGEPIDNNPFSIASMEYVAWRRGHADGVESRKAAEDMKPSED